MILTISYYIVKYIYIKRNYIIGRIKIRYLGYFLTLIHLLLSLSIILSLYFDVREGYFRDILFTNGTIFFWFISIIIFYFSRDIESKYSMIMEVPSRWKIKGTIQLGRILVKDKLKSKFYLSLDDLTQHMFITGITGSGKSNFLQSFLLELTKKHNEIPFLLTEFKGEYYHLQTQIKDMLILKPGENFNINIFDPEGSNPSIHAERVFKIFESGGLLENIEYSPQMEKVFIDILKAIIKNPKLRNWGSFETASREVLKESKDPFLKNSITAVQNRIRRYYTGSLKRIFKSNSIYKVKDLFEHKVLLDLHSIIDLGGEKEDALFFLNMILKYLWDKNIEKGSRDYKGIQHITIIEDAQYYAPQELSSKTKLTSYLEDIALLLRGTGECLITLATRPNISKEILNNAGVLVCFQIHMHKELMQELLNLREGQLNYLSELQKGQCIVRVNSIEKPFLLQNRYIERYWLTNDEILENNKKIIGNNILKMGKSVDDKLEKKVDNNIEEKKMKNLRLKRLRNKEDNIHTNNILEGEIALCNFCGNEIYGRDGYCSNCSTTLKEEDKEIIEFKDFCRSILEKQRKETKNHKINP
ncbi:MAG: ATP-binding protein [Candidatus Lokiarchaeota archaeon]|nr:ATP-binding protein [Candidatus Lokiarchaeota archaeon]